MTVDLPPPTSAYVQVVDKLGTIAAPLLAGFSLTLIGVLVGADAPKTIRWPDCTLAALTVATVLFLLAVQWTITAMQFTLTPEEHAARTASLTEQQRQVAYADVMSTFRSWSERARLAISEGIALVLLGLIGVLLPPGRLCDLAAGRVVALIGAGAALLYEIWWLSRDEIVTRRWNAAIRRGPRTGPEGREGG